MPSVQQHAVMVLAEGGLWKAMSSQVARGMGFGDSAKESGDFDREQVRIFFVY